MIEKFAKVITVVTVLVALAGCGGGGGDTSGYTGKTSASALTVSNATEMSIDVVDGYGSLSALGGIAKSVAGTPEGSLTIKELADIFDRSVSSVVQKPAVAKTVAETTSGSQPGYSGSFSYTGSFDPATGRLAATFTYNAYQASADSAYISGSVSVNGYVSQESGELERLTIVINSLQIGGIGVNHGADSGPVITVKGKMTLVNGVDQTITVSMIFTEGTSGRTYWYKDFTTVVSTGTTTMQGTFYHPDHGYVVLTTLTPLSNTTTAYGDPISGQLLFTGGSGSKVRLTYTGTGIGYLLELDAAGTGSYTAL
ncbi:hypothetical protein [Geomonas subterranea]|uniref:Lipoprotein n=1 Tax=Geomonas subterranea TaxID=2847989 RepID=A0ABX8LMA6_9BACT|nr:MULTISPECIES: hypothetical protein [Geomonas]QXE92052.1 hypothetical protein KP001_05830 [Geomonas subterranea]QXM09855.1 hypothetical protein KP002_01665 [Geomonas subterranea]